MILRLALRSLFAHPLRTAVLAAGFGLGVAVMATLLGVGEVILIQAHAPALRGGGDAVIAGPSGRLDSPLHVLWTANEAGATVAAPGARRRLYLRRQDGTAIPVRARGGIPSLERALGDPETSGIAAWADTPADAPWTTPPAADVLRAIDRFHPVPDVPARASSWAEWLYFNGRVGDVQLYLTFFVGPQRPGGRRAAGVRLQLARGGRMRSYGEAAEIEEAPLLAGAPEMTIGRSRVRLDGLRYLVDVDLPSHDRGRAERARGTVEIGARPGRWMPPLTIRGADGWVSGYTVPVLSGTLAGSLRVGGETLALDGGAGYHDHNWGFWDGVTWQWGQVQHEDLSFVYGRVRPPAGAADPDRVPGFLAALGPDGPLGHASNVTIAETNDPATGRPTTITISGRGASLDLRMTLQVAGFESTPMHQGMFGGGMDFLQMRVRYRVAGRAGDRSIDFEAPGSAETFRGR